MNADAKHDWLPARLKNAEGSIRKVGVEFELAGVPIDILADCVQTLYGGEIRQHTALESTVENSKYGMFKLELDAKSLQDLAEKQRLLDPEGKSIASSTVELISKAAEQLVPWEIVTPPIEVSELHQLERLVDALRDYGAQGTKGAFQYAFGLHLNPELPDLKAATILNYLRAYLCLYDWIVEQDVVDPTRKLTSYVKHFDKKYIEKVCDANYAPSLECLIDDYLAYNPTRNRSLDLLPLFAHLDEARVKSQVDDPRIKPRPTFHYRLPNCDICNPDWGLNVPWSLWLQVERLANSPESLMRACDAYREELNRITHSFENRWAKRSAEILLEIHREEDLA